MRAHEYEAHDECEVRGWHGRGGIIGPAQPAVGQCVRQAAVEQVESGVARCMTGVMATAERCGGARGHGMGGS